MPKENKSIGLGECGDDPTVTIAQDYVIIEAGIEYHVMLTKAQAKALCEFLGNPANWL